VISKRPDSPQRPGPAGDRATLAYASVKDFGPVFNYEFRVEDH
jgi:hypothetical protein